MVIGYDLSFYRIFFVSIVFFVMSGAAIRAQSPSPYPASYTSWNQCISDANKRSGEESGPQGTISHADCGWSGVHAAATRERYYSCYQASPNLYKHYAWGTRWQHFAKLGPLKVGSVCGVDVFKYSGSQFYNGLCWTTSAWQSESPFNEERWVPVQNATGAYKLVWKGPSLETMDPMISAAFISNGEKFYYKNVSGVCVTPMSLAKWVDTIGTWAELGSSWTPIGPNVAGRAAAVSMDYTMDAPQAPLLDFPAARERALNNLFSMIPSKAMDLKTSVNSKNLIFMNRSAKLKGAKNSRFMVQAMSAPISAKELETSLVDHGMKVELEKDRALNLLAAYEQLKVAFENGDPSLRTELLKISAELVQLGQWIAADSPYEAHNDQELLNLADDYSTLIQIRFGN